MQKLRCNDLLTFWKVTNLFTVCNGVCARSEDDMRVLVAVRDWGGQAHQQRPGGGVVSGS